MKGTGQKGKEYIDREKMSGYYKLACIEFCFENPAIHLLYFGRNSSMNILARNLQALVRQNENYILDKKDKN